MSVFKHIIDKLHANPLHLKMCFQKYVLEYNACGAEKLFKFPSRLPLISISYFKLYIILISLLIPGGYLWETNYRVINIRISTPDIIKTVYSTGLCFWKRRKLKPSGRMSNTKILSVVTKGLIVILNT